MSFQKKDLLSLEELSAQEITEVLDLAVQMKHILMQNTKKTPHLQGKSIVTLFYENSTRTRMSFELATKFMSGAASNIAASSSSVQKGETLLDTGRTLDRMGTDVIIMRHPMSGAPALLAKHVKASVINAGDGMHEHPTQGLLDLFTMREKCGRLNGLKVAILGDVMHSRVARSNMWGLKKMGADLTFAGPPTLIPKEIAAAGCKLTNIVEEAITDADVVMCLRVQLERQQKGLFPSVKEFSKLYGLNQNRLKLAKKDAIVMHPGPMNRGVEISSEVADGPQSVIDEQVTNGLAVRMAILYLLTKEEIL